MLKWRISKLDDLRDAIPKAGGLVIAPKIEVAKYMAALLEQIDGEKPVLVHSQMPNVKERISAFKNTNKRWLVAVAMISEGVDIERLRVLVYLPSVQTELSFRQAMGRVVRTPDPCRDRASRADTALEKTVLSRIWADFGLYMASGIAFSAAGRSTPTPALIVRSFRSGSPWRKAAAGRSRLKISA